MKGLEGGKNGGEGEEKKKKTAGVKGGAEDREKRGGKNKMGTRVER